MDERPINMLLEKLERVKKHSWGYRAQCPAHDDRVRSLSFKEGEDGRVLIKCHAGCTVKAIVGALGMDIKDVMPPKDETVYKYLDGAGFEIYEKVRLLDKSMFWRKPDGSPGIEGIKRVLYNQPGVDSARIAGQRIYLHEGEKAADAFNRRGWTSTTHGLGAGKWEDDFTEALSGSEVWIVADRDQPGELHAQYVAGELKRAKCKVKIVQSATTRNKDDGYDHVAAGYGPNALVRRRDLEPPAERRWVPFSIKIARDVPWLVEPYLPRECVSMIQGDGGVGKSTVSRAIAAALSRGRWTIGQSYADLPVKTILLSAEDGADSVILPHLKTLGANPELVIGPEMEDDEGKPVPLVLNHDGMRELETAVMDTKAQLVVIDPVLSYFVSGKEINAALDVRGWMDQLTAIARKSGCAVLLIHHMNKAEKMSHVYRSIGSVDFYNASRSVMMASAISRYDFNGSAEQDDAFGVLFHIKCNLGPKAPPRRYVIHRNGDLEWERMESQERPQQKLL